MNFLKTHIKNILFYFGLVFFLLLVAFFINIKFPYQISGYFFNLNKNNINDDIVIVKIDNKTINSDIFQKYKDISRSDYASVLKNIMLKNADIVGVDISFVGSSKEKSEDKELQKVLDKYEDKIILAREIGENLEPLSLGIDHEHVGYVNVDSENKTNFLNILKTKDIINKVPVYFTGTNPNIPFSIALYKSSFDIQNININQHNIKIDEKKIPLDNSNGNSYLNINYFGNENNYKSVSFVDVYKNRVPSSIFKNKKVFLGVHSPLIGDEFNTPISLDNNLPGVITHVNLFNTLTSGKYLYYISLFEYAVLFLIFIFVSVFTTSKSKNIWIGIVYSSLVLILFVVLDVLLFLTFGILINVLPFIGIYIFSNLIIFLKRYFEEKKYKDEIRGMFSKYVSDDIVEYITSLGIENIGLGGTTRNITVFFSDLVGFTSLSEKLSEKELGRVLNIYLEEMSNIILSNKGTIDKYIGDAIMAFWNAPLDVDYHPDKACDTAIMQMKSLEKVKNELKDNADASKLDTRIGINTGESVVGNFGSSKRYDYTALGDAVNLASRLEGISKQYGTNVIISENTYKGITSDKFLIRELDAIAVKGKTEPVKIYELIGYKEEFKSGFIEKIEKFEKALFLYKNQYFQDAKKIFEEVGDYASEVFIGRCEEFVKNPPGDDWDGVFRFKTK